MQSNKSSKIREKLLANRKLSVKNLAKEVGCDVALVYHIRAELYPDSVRKYTVKTRKLKNKRKALMAALGPTLRNPNASLDDVRDKLSSPMRKLLAEQARKELAQRDMVNSPPHYTAGGVEVYDFIKAKKLSYELGNVVKYVSRADHKGSRLEDLKKAQWYLAAAIKQEERV